MCNDDNRAVAASGDLDRWCNETYEERMSFGVRAGEPKVDLQSDFQRIRILNTEFGETLLLDDAFMTATAVEHYYHEMLVHPAMVVTPSIKRVLVIGGGDGGTVREVLRYPEVQEVTLCELDPSVVFQCQHHLRSMNVPWKDPRLKIFCEDGAEFVKRADPGYYDVILVDGADPVGPAAVLFSDGFYKDCRRAMSESGTLASQTESPIAMREDFLKIVRTMRANFRRAQPCFGPMPIYPGGTWSWTHATDRNHWVTAEAFIERRMRVAEKHSKYFNRYVFRAAFALPNDLLRELGR